MTSQTPARTTLTTSALPPTGDLGATLKRAALFVALAAVLLFVVATAMSGCAPSEDAAAIADDSDVAAVDEATEAAIDQELTSNTALSRTLTFSGTVFVATTASDDAILETIRDQTQSAFGALREANIAVNSRELKDVDPSTFVKTTVTVVEPASPTRTRTMKRVTYKYTDNALVPKSMARRSSISLGLLNPGYQSQSSRVLTECTSNDSHAREFASSIWYVFNPVLSACKRAMAAEQKRIDADRALVKSTSTRVPASETTRLYVPMTARLGGDKTNKGATYPEYDRLYKGGVKPGKLVVGMVSGLMADWAAGEKHDTVDDEGWVMFFEQLREVFLVRPNFKLTAVEPIEDLSTYTVNGKTYKGITFAQITRWELDETSWPAGLPYADRRALRNAVAQKVSRHWLTFEAPITVKTGSTAARPLTLQLNAYFGAETDPTPHKRGIKTSDIFVYNGHSYIGYGPLDPNRFNASDFPNTYQILFMNSCVSYNYYEKDYFPLKTGGTRNLDLITNGLESWVNESGPSMGRFVGALLNGEQEDYSSLLRAAEFQGFGYTWGQDALRVVDGELDNVYSPQRTPIVVTAR